jgi:uncharacterized protein (DUF302 family)
MGEGRVRYGLQRVVGLPYEEADRRVREALQAEGFGVLTEIDVQATLKRKLDVDVPRYEILGACNPPLAKRGIGREASVGLLLPCNVVVREGGEAGRTVVEAIDPVVQMEVTENESLRVVAGEVRGRLERVLDRLGGAAGEEGRHG